MCMIEALHTLQKQSYQNIDDVISYTWNPELDIDDWLHANELSLNGKVKFFFREPKLNIFTSYT